MQNRSRENAKCLQLFVIGNVKQQFLHRIEPNRNIG